MNDPNDFYQKIHAAAAVGNLATLRACLAAGVPVDLMDNDHRPPLHHAVDKNQIEAVRLLIAEGSDVNAGIYSSIHRAVYENNATIVSLLLEAGAKTAPFDYENYFWESPLHWAAVMGRTDIARLLIEHAPSQIDACSGDWPMLAALHKAAQRGHTDTVRLLLDAGADVNLLTEEGVAPIHICTEPILPMLLAAGADIEAAGKKGWTPLHCAVLRNETGIVSALLEAGARVNRHISQEQGSFSPALSLNAPFAVVDPDGRNYERHITCKSTALHMAAGHGCNKSVHLLLVHGANVHATDMRGRTPLHEAARLGTLQNVHVLLNAGADIEARDADGATPLLLAAGRGAGRRLIRFLMKRGANLHVCDHAGRTAMHLAAMRDHRQNVRYLIAHGLNTEARDNEGKTALQLAEEYGKQTICRIIRARGNI